ncbi:17145_t:CDS:2 [Gigaspora rosea]|nr:17145_t:CDS:2 [Gigaspora rosea]
MNFKILILGAGYGTQLQRDILQDTSQKYSHLLGSPKALLPVGVYVVTNNLSYHSFISWADRNSIPRSNIVNDKSTCNEDQLVGGDTLFLRDFNFNKLFDQFSTFNDGCLVTTYTIQEIFSLLQSPL